MPRDSRERVARMKVEGSGEIVLTCAANPLESVMTENSLVLEAGSVT